KNLDKEIIKLKNSQNLKPKVLSLKYKTRLYIVFKYSFIINIKK
ncbi:unnamed protein product, partial [marine sediment metagenome]